MAHLRTAAVPAAVHLLPARAAEDPPAPDRSASERAQLLRATRDVWLVDRAVNDGVVVVALPLAGFVRGGGGGAAEGTQVNDGPHPPAPPLATRGPLSLLDSGPSPAQSS